jgi:hypothetical protein
VCFRSVALALLLVGLPSGAEEDPRVAFLSRQLGSASDPRARVQAALTLGATEANGARDPLCSALADPVPMVRQAAARALPELHDLSALSCLLAHGADPAADAAAEIRRSVAVLREVEGRAPVVAVWVEGVKDPSTPPLGPELLAEARIQLVRHLAWVGARSGEAESAPRPPPRSVPAYLLKPSLLRTEQGLVMAAVCLTWPGKVILGEVRVKGSGGAPPDLVRALVPRLVQDASRTFEWDLKL